MKININLQYNQKSLSRLEEIKNGKKPTQQTTPQKENEEVQIPQTTTTREDNLNNLQNLGMLNKYNLERQLKLKQTLNKTQTPETEIQKADTI